MPATLYKKNIIQVQGRTTDSPRWTGMTKKMVWTRNSIFKEIIPKQPYDNKFRLLQFFRNGKHITGMSRVQKSQKRIKYEHAMFTTCSKCRYGPQESQKNWDGEENGMNKEFHFLRGSTKATLWLQVQLILIFQNWKSHCRRCPIQVGKEVFKSFASAHKIY